MLSKYGCSQGKNILGGVIRMVLLLRCGNLSENTFTGIGTQKV